MSSIECVAEYIEDGFAILEDEHGKFLMFEDSDKLIDIEDIKNIVKLTEAKHSGIGSAEADLTH